MVSIGTTSECTHAPFYQLLSIFDCEQASKQDQYFPVYRIESQYSNFVEYICLHTYVQSFNLIFHRDTQSTCNTNFSETMTSIFFFTNFTILLPKCAIDIQFLNNFFCKLILIYLI